MAGRVRQELADADAALLVLNGEQGVGPGDRYIARVLAAGALPVVIAVNKMDRLSRQAAVTVLSWTCLALFGLLAVIERRAVPWARTQGAIA